MMIGRIAASLLLCALPLGTAKAADTANTIGDCSEAPEGAVTALPAPLSEWGTLFCSPESGHMLVPRPGWMWKFVDTMKNFGLPADFGQNADEPAYFIGIKMNEAPLEHPLTLNAAEALHQGLAPASEPWEKAQVVTLGNTREQGVRVFIFEKTHERAGLMRWGIMCNWDATQCSPGHRFMILDMRDQWPGG